MTPTISLTGLTRRGAITGLPGRNGAGKTTLMRWATSFVGLTLLFVYGLWWGLIYQRWNRIGLRVFVVAQVALLLAVGLTADRFGAWPSIGRFFTDLTAPGLTGLLAVIAALLIVGGFVTMRRVRV